MRQRDALTRPGSRRPSAASSDVTEPGTKIDIFDASPDLAHLANDEMAAIAARHPDRFPSFVASLPMNNPDAAVCEIDRAIDHLGATGVQIYDGNARRLLRLTLK